VTTFEFIKTLIWPWGVVCFFAYNWLRYRLRHSKLCSRISELENNLRLALRDQNACSQLFRSEERESQELRKVLQQRDSLISDLKHQLARVHAPKEAQPSAAPQSLREIINLKPAPTKEVNL